MSSSETSRPFWYLPRWATRLTSSIKADAEGSFILAPGTFFGLGRPYFPAAEAVGLQPFPGDHTLARVLSGSGAGQAKRGLHHHLRPGVAQLRVAAAQLNLDVVREHRNTWRQAVDGDVVRFPLRGQALGEGL